MIITSWRPKKRNVSYQEKPDYVPEWVYTEAVTAKHQYNENWEFWVWNESQTRNVSQATAEDACIRGIKTALDRIDFIYGPKVGKWYKEFLNMDELFKQVQHPEYLEVKLEGV